MHCDFIYQINKIVHEQGFPGSLDGKESAYNAGDPNLIPVLGRSAGEEIGYPFQWTPKQKEKMYTLIKGEKHD